MMRAEDISELSVHLINFLDLAGHRRYMRTTIQAVSGYSPHFSALIIASGNLNSMTRENLQIIKAFKIPFFVVITKIDLVSPDETLEQLYRLLYEVDALKAPLLINSSNDFQTLDIKQKCVPIFCISNVSGAGMDLIQKYLFKLTIDVSKTTEKQRLDDASPEFHIDEIFQVQGVGTIVGGLLVRGTMNESMTLKCGPFGPNGDFYSAVVNSIHRNKFPCKTIRSNQSASVSFSLINECHFPNLRNGMVLLGEKYETSACIFFQATIVIQHPCIKGIKKGFQNTIHIGSIRQTAVIEGIFGRESLYLNQTGSCLFRFLVRPEFVRIGNSILLRDGNLLGVGIVTQIFPIN